MHMDRAHVGAPGHKPGTDQMVQPLGQSLQSGESGPGHLQGDTQWRLARSGRLHHPAVARRMGAATRPTEARTAGQNVSAKTGESSMDTQAGKHGAKTVRNTRRTGPGGTDGIARGAGTYLRAGICRSKLWVKTEHSAIDCFEEGGEPPRSGI